MSFTFVPPLAEAGGVGYASATPRVCGVRDDLEMDAAEAAFLAAGLLHERSWALRAVVFDSVTVEDGGTDLPLLGCGRRDVGGVIARREYRSFSGVFGANPPAAACISDMLESDSYSGEEAAIV